MERQKTCDKARRIIGQVSSNKKMIAALRYIARSPGEWIKHEPHRSDSRKLNRTWKRYFWLACRILGVAWHRKARGLYRVPATFEISLLSRIGLDLFEPDTRCSFNGLPLNFLLSDPVLCALSEANPHVLERVKTHLIKFYKLDQQFVRPRSGAKVIGNGECEVPHHESTSSNSSLDRKMALW